MQVGIPRLPGMLFSFSITNPHARVSRIWTYNFELYHVPNPATAVIRFLGPLVANLAFLPDWLNDFPQSQVRPCDLAWNFERGQIQSIEDSRNGDVFFEVKGSLLVASDYAGGAAAQREVAWDVPYLNNAYPIRLQIAQSDWVKLLDEMKFTHILLHEFPAPAFDPAFARSAAYWTEAWNHHRKNEADSALMSVFKAFECLGFELLGTTAASREQLVRSLLANEPKEKQDSFLEILDRLQIFMHLGRHAKGQPSRVNRNDSEMILLCSAAVLGYLSKQHASGSAPKP
jgi:hypothetical protein